MFFWHLLWLMLPDRMHGRVWFRMSDVKPVAPSLLGKVTREKASSLAQKAVANPHLCSPVVKEANTKIYEYIHKMV